MDAKWLGMFAFLILVSAPFFAAPAHAQEALAEISAPADGGTVDILDRLEVAYRIVPGYRGDHSHIYIDGEEVGILRQLEGRYPLESLAIGDHAICVKVVNKAHVPIGVEDCVAVTVADTM